MKSIRHMMTCLGCIFTGVLFFPFGFAESRPLSEADVERFGHAIAHVRSFYVEELDESEILENAMDGMLEGLDPHSAYLDEEDLKLLMESTQGAFGGLGIELTVEAGLIKVIAPIDDTPAYKAGIKAGDFIAEVDSKPVRDMTLSQAVEAMRGEPGTAVVLTVLRKGEINPLKFTLNRAIIDVVSIKHKTLEDKYAYIRITQFQEDTAKNLAMALRDLSAKSKDGMRGIILDLRNNPGGLLDSAIAVADIFLDSNTLNKHKKLIVFTKGRSQDSKMAASSETPDLTNNTPMVVLINEGSASASEIVAGALQDHHRAVIIGAQSFGKGSVQTVFPLDNKNAIKLTTALYYTPAGRAIQAKGIKPDIHVDQLQVSEPASKSVKLNPLHESTLDKHIENNQKDAHDALSQYQAKMKNGNKLAREDYQLYAALNILKALHVTNQRLQGHNVEQNAFAKSK